MRLKTLLFGGVTAIALAACAANAQDNVVRSAEGAILDTSGNLSYAPGELTEEQITSPTAHLFTMQAMNVFRRFPRDKTEEMVNFYVNALNLRSLNPIQLTSTQQMILTGVGSAQIKLSAGQMGDHSYNLEGGYAGGTGIRFFVLSFPDAEIVTQRFLDNGFEAPQFSAAPGGLQFAMVTDPGGFDIIILIRPGAQDGSNDGVMVGVHASDLDESRTFYRDFVGLQEGQPFDAAPLGTTLYPYRNGETTILLYNMGTDLPADTGSAGIQYVVSDAAMVEAKASRRGVEVQTPLNTLRGFDLTTIWLYDPDGVTNYFAQVGPSTPAIEEAE